MGNRKRRKRRKGRRKKREKRRKQSRERVGYGCGREKRRVKEEIGQKGSERGQGVAVFKPLSFQSEEEKAFRTDHN